MAFNTFGLKKKKNDKKQTGHTCPVFTVSLWGDSHHFLVAQDALRGGHGRRWTVKCHCFWLIFASLYKLVCCPCFFCTGFQFNKSDMEKNSIADLLRYISFTGCSILKATSIRTYNTNKSKVLVPSMDPEDIVAPKKGAPN